MKKKKKQYLYLTRHNNNQIKSHSYTQHFSIKLHLASFDLPLKCLSHIKIILPVKHILQTLNQSSIRIHQNQHKPIQNGFLNIQIRLLILSIVLKQNWVQISLFKKFESKLWCILEQNVRREFVIFDKELNKGHLEYKVVVDWHFFKETLGVVGLVLHGKLE